MPTQILPDYRNDLGSAAADDQVSKYRRYPLALKRVLLRGSGAADSQSETTQSIFPDASQVAPDFHYQQTTAGKRGDESAHRKSYSAGTVAPPYSAAYGLPVAYSTTQYRPTYLTQRAASAPEAGFPSPAVSPGSVRFAPSPAVLDSHSLPARGPYSLTFFQAIGSPQDAPLPIAAGFVRPGFFDSLIPLALPPVASHNTPSAFSGAHASSTATLDSPSAFAGAQPAAAPSPQRPSLDIAAPNHFTPNRPLRLGSVGAITVHANELPSRGRLHSQSYDPHANAPRSEDELASQSNDARANDPESPQSEREDDLYSQWYSARAHADFDLMNDIGLLYLQRFPQGKYSPYISAALNQFRPVAAINTKSGLEFVDTTNGTKSSQTPAAGAYFPVQRILDLRRRGFSDDQIMRVIQDSIAAQIGLNDADVAYLTQRYGRHPFSNIVEPGSNTSSSLDSIIHQGNSNRGIAEFRIDPDVIADILALRNSYRPGQAQIEQAAFSEQPYKMHLLREIAADKTTPLPISAAARVLDRVLSNNPSVAKALDDFTAGLADHAAMVAQTASNLAEFARHPGRRLDEFLSDVFTGGYLSEHNKFTPMPTSELAEFLAQAAGPDDGSLIRRYSHQIADLLPLAIASAAGGLPAVGAYTYLQNAHRGPTAAFREAASAVAQMYMAGKLPLGHLAGDFAEDLVSGKLAPTDEMTALALRGADKAALRAATISLQRQLAARLAGIGARGLGNSASFIVTSAAVTAALQGHKLTLGELKDSAAMLAAMELLPAAIEASGTVRRATGAGGISGEQDAERVRIQASGRQQEPARPEAVETDWSQAQQQSPVRNSSEQSPGSSSFTEVPRETDATKDVWVPTASRYGSRELAEAAPKRLAEQLPELDAVVRPYESGFKVYYRQPIGQSVNVASDTERARFPRSSSASDPILPTAAEAQPDQPPPVGSPVAGAVADAEQEAPAPGQLGVLRGVAGTGQPSPGGQPAPPARAPVLLGPGRPTTQALPQVLALTGHKRWQGGERLVGETYGSSGHRYFRVPQTTVPNAITRSGGRFIDEAVHMSGNRTLAIEVKTYMGFRTVSGGQRTMRVPLTKRIRRQILKDVWLRDNVPGFDPRWIFLDAPPTPDLARFLDHYRIVSIVHM